MKKNNVFFCGILTILLASGLMSCATSNVIIENVGAVPSSALSGKTVMLEIGMAEWNRAVIPLLDAQLYNAALNRVLDQFDRLQTEQLIDLHSQLALFYSDLYQAEVVSARFPFEVTDNISYSAPGNYFDNLNPAEIQIIRNIAAANNAEYVLAIIGQIRTVGVGAFGRNGTNRLFFNMALFDRSGGIVAKGVVGSAPVRSPPGDVHSLASMFNSAIPSLRSLLRAIGS